MKRNSFIVAILALVVSACGKQIPSDIIQPNEMQNLLYDYHIAGSLSADVPYSDEYKKESYFKYVFKKHNVTEALFDSSMVWYSRHANVLSEIYKDLNTRLEKEEEKMRNLIRMREGQISVSFSGDSVDIWQDRKMFWLTSSKLLNKLTFSLKADTSFKYKDELELSAHFLFLPDKMKSEVNMGLSIVYENDGVQGVTTIVNESGVYSLRVKADSTFRFRNINGYIYYTAHNKKESSVVLDNICLMRYHDKTKAELEPIEKQNIRLSNRKAR